MKPHDTVGKPTLVVFSDGSSIAYGTCAYVRWELAGNKYVVRLIAAKNRIAPTHQITIPRLELCGAVLAVRLRETIVREIDWEFDTVFHIVDSLSNRAISNPEGDLWFQNIRGNQTVRNPE